MKKFWIGFLIVGILIGGVMSALEDDEDTVTFELAADAEVVETTEATEAAEAAEHTVLSFLDNFIEYGYTAEQIEAMRAILVNVGITEISELEIGEVSYGMQVVKGVAPKDVRVQFNIENGVLYYVHIYSSNLNGLLDDRADLYYEFDGGYLKKIDWENETVVDYN